MTTLDWGNKYENVDNINCSNDIYQQPIHEITDNVVFDSRQRSAKTIEDTELHIEATRRKEKKKESKPVHHTVLTNRPRRQHEVRNESSVPPTQMKIRELMELSVTLSVPNRTLKPPLNKNYYIFGMTWAETDKAYKYRIDVYRLVLPRCRVSLTFSFKSVNIDQWTVSNINRFAIVLFTTEY
ncbi:hypothetical protein QTP88_022280 [Uroleucon formosanum]